MRELNQSEKKPGILPLILIAFIIILCWQFSALLTPALGPIDALLVWLLRSGNLISSTFPSLLLIITVSGTLISSAIIFTSYGRGKWIWYKWKQKLAQYNKNSEKATPRPPPIIGVEVTSLPLTQHFLNPISLTEGHSFRGVGYPSKYSHWTALHNELKELSFEVEIESSVSIRFWLPQKQGSREQLDMLCSSLQTSYGNLEFIDIPSTSIPTIFGSFTTMVQLKENTIAFENEFISIVQIEGTPGPVFESTQLDKLIFTLTERGIRSTLVVNFSSKNVSPKRLETINSTKIGQNQHQSISSTQLLHQTPASTETGLGFWEVSAYLVIRSNHKKEHLARVKSAQVILETIFHNPINPIKTKILKNSALSRAVSRVLYRKKLQKTALLSSQQLALLVHLPQQAQPGFLRKHLAEFELPPQKETDLVLFNVMKGNRVLYPTGINLAHLTTHMVVAGQTGKGKTYFVGNLIHQIKKHSDIGITIFDWKGEYKQLMKTLFRIGEENCKLRINLFETHGIERVEEYVQNLVSLLRELIRDNVESDLSSQMERILRESLIDYLKQGPGCYEEYEKFLAKWISKNKADFSYPESSMAGLINRFGRLFRGKLGYIFNTPNTTIDFKALLSDQVCFDLSTLVAYSKDDARLFLNTILMVIRSFLFRTFSEKLRYLVVAEEAQYLVPEVFTKRSSAEASPAEDITLFQRAYGIGLIAITTRPNLISRNILANSGTKIFFQCPLDANLIGDTVNLTVEQRQYLSLMPEKIVIAHLPWFEHPFKAQTCQFEFPAKSRTPLKPECQTRFINDSLLREESGDTLNIIDPVIRHFLDLTSSSLFKEEILHRIIRIDSNYVIDIPRNDVIVTFQEEAMFLNRLPMSNMAELASKIVIFYPPRLKKKFEMHFNHLTRHPHESGFFEEAIYLAPFTRSEILKLISHIKTGQLSTPSITRALHQNLAY